LPFLPSAGTGFSFFSSSDIFTPRFPFLGLL
jgi:hypothetical protein